MCQFKGQCHQYQGTMLPDQETMSPDLWTMLPNPDTFLSDPVTTTGVNVAPDSLEYKSEPMTNCQQQWHCYT